MARKLLLLILLAGLLAACRQDDPAQSANGTPVAEAGGTPQLTTEAPATTATPSATDTPAPTPTITPTPIPPKDLVVCLSGEPADLYLYGDTSPAAVAVRHALYESPFTSLGYAYQPLALEKLADLADGDARLEAVEVGENSLVVNTDGEIVPLLRGVEVIDAAGQTVVFDRAPIQMSRLVVDSTFQPLVWSDGTPVTAEDSVYSYQIASDRGTPRLDEFVRYTVDYQAVDERTVRWTGLPGYLDPAYMTHVWTPLPRHHLAEFSAADLPATEEAARAPLSYGPFVLDEWTEGESLRLIPNPHYYRAAEGLPHLTSLTFRFLTAGESATALPAEAEGCHVLTADLLSFDALPAVQEAEAEGTLSPHLATAGVVEQILFGIDSTADYAENHVRWFEDARVRQAITQCTDRQGLVEELTYGQGAVMDTYVPAGHSLYPDEVTQWPYDPAAGNALLDQVGFVDATGDGVRDALGATTPFTVTVGTNAESPLRLRIIERVQADLAACGIQATLTPVPAGAWFAPGPGGIVFGRKFDLAQFAWLSRVEPDCGLYLSDNTPGSLAAGYNGWDGVNASGWANEAFDAACRTARALLPGQPGYVEAHQEAMRLFAQELPAMPLFTRLRLAATTPDVLNFRLDATQPSELWNVYEWDLRLGG